MTDRYRIGESGWRDAEPEPVIWRSGLWALELRGDEFADVRYDGVLVLRSIRGVIRDRDWDTVPSETAEVTITRDRLTVTMQQTGLRADFDGTVTLSVRGDELLAELELTALTDFWRKG